MNFENEILWKILDFIASILIWLKKVGVYIWSNFYAKIIVVYLIYLIFVWILYLFSRKFIKKLILKTSTTLDDKIVRHTKKWIVALLLLLGINVSFSIFGFENKLLILFYKLIKTAELLIFLIILIKSLKVSKRHFILKYKSDKEKLNLLNLLFLTLQISVYSIWVLIFLNIWNVNIAPLLASAGIVGFAVAMASQEIIKNFISWIILFFEKPFVVWDIVKLPDGRNATVEEIWLRMTKFKTYLWDTIFVPNSKLLDTIETVRGHITEKRKIELEVGLPYWVDIEKAKEILMKVLQSEELFIKDSLEVFISSLWDWSVNFKLRWDVEVSKYDRRLPYRLYEKIYNEINKAWIGFPFPTYEVIVDKNKESSDDRNKQSQTILD